MFEAVKSPYLASFSGEFQLKDYASLPETPLEKSEAKKKLKKKIKKMAELQDKLYADNRFSLLLIFQAMDAAGKDSTIKAVMSGLNPSGCQVFVFKQPSAEELDHDFLWRAYRAMPERGRIGVFNRSYYEEILVVRVHEEWLEKQNLPWKKDGIWKDRIDSIRDMEHHLARNGTVVLKFFLHVSRDEQRRRFISRLKETEKFWKFNAGDLKESTLWEDYQNAYQKAIRGTSESHAPWYIVPADDKPNMRLIVADIICKTLKELPLAYPEVSAEDRSAMAAILNRLEAEENPPQ